MLQNSAKTFKITGASNDALRLRMLPFSLKDKAKVWLNNLQPGYITTWDFLVQKFLSKCFPLIKTAKLMSEINSFSQEDE
jgi:hypothetical protein